MAGPEFKQRLAAILAADVAGYSRLMGGDEPATIATLHEFRDVFRDAIEAHGGRVVDMAGDSVLSVFDSTTGAVTAAVKTQAELALRNESLTEGRRMLFRVGVNLGDIRESADGSVYGDGVNIAARLESLAEPGGIMVSGSVFDGIDGKLDVGFEDAGAHEVKNIARPVRAFRVTDCAPTPRLASAASVSPRKADDKPSIVVLPFDNISGDPEQGYFADGISEDVITDLSKVSGLFVIARNSAFAYKGQSPNIEQVCQELGVRFVLEGSVRKAGGRVRINAQLIDGATGGHLWAERYDRELHDIFEVQDDVTQQIVTALKVRLTSAEKKILARKSTSNLEAYDAVLRAWAYIWMLSREGNETALPWLEKAAALDPGYAAPLATIAIIKMTDGLNRWGEGWEESLRVGHELASKAVVLDDLEPIAHQALGTVYLWKGDHDRAIAEVERAIELDPNFAGAHALMGMILHYAGASATALQHNENSVWLDPHAAKYVLHNTALCHFMLGEYEIAARELRERIAKLPDTDISRALLAATYGHQGRIDDAQAVWAELMEVNPDYSFAQKRKILPYKNPEDLEHIAHGFRKAGIDISAERAGAM